MRSPCAIALKRGGRILLTFLQTHTGDIAQRDADVCIPFVGRADDLLDAFPGG